MPPILRTHRCLALHDSLVCFCKIRHVCTNDWLYRSDSCKRVCGYIVAALCHLHVILSLSSQLYITSLWCTTLQTGGCRFKQIWDCLTCNISFSTWSWTPWTSFTIYALPLYSCDRQGLSTWSRKCSFLLCYLWQNHQITSSDSVMVLLHLLNEMLKFWLNSVIISPLHAEGKSGEVS